MALVLKTACQVAAARSPAQLSSSALLQRTPPACTFMVIRSMLLQAAEG